MILQVAGPLVGNVYATGTSEALTVEVYENEDGLIQLEWKFDLEKANGEKYHTAETGLTLNSEFPGKLMDGYIELGTFTISKDGLMRVTIHDEFLNVPEEEIVEEEEKKEITVSMVTVEIDENSLITISAKVTGTLEDEKAKVEIVNEEEEVVDSKEDIEIQGETARAVFENLEPGKYYAIVTVDEISETSEVFEIEEAVVDEEDSDEPESEEEGVKEGDSDDVESEEELEIEKVSIFGEPILTVASTKGSLDGLVGSDDEYQEYEGKIIIPFGLLAETKPEEGINLGSEIFKGVNIIINNTELEEGTTEIEISDGLQLQITFDWELDDVDLTEGDWAQIKIPDVLKGVAGQMNGNLLDDDGTTVGTYEITDDGYLRVVFNDELIELEDRSGEVGFLLEFNLTEFEEDSYQKIEFEELISKEFIIKAKQTGTVHDIKKFGKPDTKINPTYIDWTIDVNTTLEDLVNATVEDNIPEGLELVFESIEIYELKVGYKGALAEGDPVDKAITPNGNSFKVELGKTNKAYRIRYRTNIEEFKNEYENKAVLNDNDVWKAEDIYKVDGLERGTLIDKTGWKNKSDGSAIEDQVIWQIDVNQAQTDLKSAKVLDTIPQGLKINKIDVYKLNKSDNGWSQGEHVKTVGVFPVELKDGNDAYRIIVTTDIDFDYFKEYTKELTFKNTAELEVEDEVVDEDDATVTVNRGSLLAKGGKDTTDYKGAKISWTITVNEARHTIKNAVITDTIGAGLELIDDTVKVFDANGEPVFENTGYTFTNTGNAFTIAFIGDTDGNIKEKYSIEYDTKIIGNLAEGQEGYKNTVDLGGEGLGGDGVGEGDTTKEQTVKPSVSNTYKKESGSFGEKAGITYDGLNYAAKTMSWKLTVDSIKEEITELKITDSFEPAKSMKFIKDSLRVVIGERVLILATDYTLDDKGVDGFVLDFIGNHKPLEREKYEIYFKTSFDPNKVIEASGTPVEGNGTSKDKVYKNHVTYTGFTKNVEEGKEDKVINEKDDASYSVGSDYINGGKKSGTLDRENRTINWEIYANASGRNLTAGAFVITDKLITANQTINEDVEVYKFSLNKDGTPEKGDKITTGFEIKYNEDKKSFTLTFTNGVNHPVLVEFSSKINDQSVEWYENQAVVTDTTNIEKTYTGKVEYHSYNTFITKEATDGTNNGTAYTDDEIEWKISLNESLSNIKNAEFKDTISKGLVLINNSIIVYKGYIAEDNIVKNLPSDAISITTNVETGGTDLSIELGDIGENRYFITYKTVVIAKDGKVSNQASLLGGEKVLGNSGEKKYEARQSSWGTGSGKENRGQIEIVKVDSETKEPISIPAKFELYYYLNGDQKQIVTGEKQVTKDGKIQYGNLPFRTYYLKEIEEPIGYNPITPDQVPEEFTWDNDEKAIKIVVNNKKVIEIKVENTRKTYAIGDYTWIDTDKNGIQDKDEPILIGVKVELFREDGITLLGTTKTDGNGFYIFDELVAGKYFVKFTLTEKQAEIYEFTKLTTEVENPTRDSNANPKAGDNYGWTTLIDLGDESVTKDYENKLKNGYLATEGIDPTWDAGVILREKIDITGTKTWDDKNNQDGKRPESIIIKLLADGKEIGSRTVTATDMWKWTFTDLYKSESGSEPIVYTIVEETVEGYSAKINGYDVTNSYTPGTTSVQVTKSWIDFNDKNGDRPESITVKLLADEEDTGKTLIITKENNWTNTFIELDAYKAGKKIVYTVEEVVLDEYNTEITGNASAGFVVTNTRKTYAIGDYTWIDSNKDGIQDEDEKVLVGVKVELYDEDGKTLLDTTHTDGNGLYIFDELVAGKYKVKFILTEEQAKIYEFTKQNSGKDTRVDSDAEPETGWTVVITLDDSNGYLKEDYTNQGFEATEGIDPTWDAGVIFREIEVTGRKVWVNGPKPAIELQLYKNGEPYGELVELNGREETPWTHTWTELHEYDESGKKHIYTVDEVELPIDYGKSMSEDELTITNTYKSPVTDIVGRKVWIGGPSRKPTIELQLYRDDIAYLDSVELKDGETSHTWIDLDKTDINGKEYVYTVDEVKVPSKYRKTISEDGLTITNSYSPPVDPEEPYNPEVPSDPEGRLKIVKRDNKTNELLSGAEFDIVDSRGRRVDTLVTNSRGEATSKWLPIGNYTIEEVKAPEGYKLDSRLGVERVRNGETLEIVIYNEKEDPTEPEKPVEPEKPIEPTDPERPTDPTTPGGPGDEFEDVDGGNPSDKPEGEDEFEDGGGGNPSGKPKLPKTGSASPVLLYGLGGLSILVGMMLRKKED